MTKRVIGIILTALGGYSIFSALIWGLACGSIGIVSHAVGANMDDDFMQESTTKSCSGEVIDVDNSVTTIQYEVDGVVYAADINMQTTSYPVGTEVTVYYDETEPEECRVPELTEATMGMLGKISAGLSIVFGIGFCVLGIVCLVIGIILIKKSLNKKNISVTNVTNSLS